MALTDKATQAEKLAKSYLRGAKRIEKKHFSLAPRNRMSAGIELARERAALVDSFIKKAAADAKGQVPEGVSLVALGGYGRREMCPFSDIDILVLHKPGFEKAAAQTGEKVFYPLWDLKLELGHAVRTLDDCADLCARDFVSLTSHLDNRFIAGDRGQYGDLGRLLSAEILPSCSARFINDKLTEAFERRKRFGSSVWMLEPNIKEAEGALRDLNTILWLGQAKYKIRTFEDLLGKGIMSEKEHRLTTRCMSFLFLARSHLHYLAGRRQDKLTFDFQSGVARFFGHRDSSMKAVEKFMRIYYLRAGFVSEQFQRMVERVAGGPARRVSQIRHLEHGFTISDGVLSVTGKNVFRETPVNLIRAFECADRHGAEMSAYMRALIREQAPRIDEKTRRDPEFSRIFIRILKSGRNVYKTLLLMNRLRFLAHYMPEFGRIVCMMRHNAYHLYTVDVHSLFLVKEVEKLFKYEREDEFPLLTKVAESVVSREILYLACLLHDIGKGVSGVRHEIAGRDMVRKINRRLGLSGRSSEVLEFLIENHQVMSDFSQKQDINDIELVSKFARAVGDEERLSLLYILTFADLRSVGGDVWNNWKGMLLRRLYFSASRVFESGRVGQARSFAARKKMVCSEIARISEGAVSESEAARIIKTMPESYLLSHSPLDMERHFRLMKKSARGGIVTEVIHHEKEGFDEFIFWGKDRKKLFRTLCGVMSANGLDIMAVRAEGSSGGNVLDILYVSRFGKSASDSPELWKKLDDDIKNALSGKLDLDAVLKKRGRIPSYRAPAPQQPPRVFFDNASSDRATIVEVAANDEPGILYKISSVISDMDLSIIHAKVSTRAEQVFDIFYVTRRGGRKVENPDILEKLEKALLKVISPKPRSVLK